MMLLVVMIGLLSLVFGIWISYGLYQRFSGQLPEISPRNSWLLGVCEDFSRLVGIPLWIVRFFFLIYTFVCIGLLLYMIYYFVMRVRRPAGPTEEDTPVPQVTKIESRYYRN